LARGLCARAGEQPSAAQLTPAPFFFFFFLAAAHFFWANNLRRPIRPTGARARRSPRPGRNLGLGRESRLPPRPFSVQLAARSISAVRVNPTVERQFREIKKPPRRSGRSQTLGHISFVSSLRSLSAAQPSGFWLQALGHAGRRAPGPRRPRRPRRRARISGVCGDLPSFCCLSSSSLPFFSSPHKSSSSAWSWRPVEARRRRRRGPPCRRACSPVVEHAAVERPRSGAIGSRACAAVSRRRAAAPIAFPRTVSKNHRR
jgi:hypothetical protein